MQLTKELIIKVLNEFSEKHTDFFAPKLTFVTEEYYSDVADEILSKVEGDSEVQPQLQQANVMRAQSAEPLPDFLYKDGERVRVGVTGNSDVTSEWQSWLSGNGA